MCASGSEPVASPSTTATAPPRGSWQSLKPSAKDLSLWWAPMSIARDSSARRIAFDHVICVTAPEPLRVERIMARDHVSRDRALEWIRRQMPQQRMVELSHYVIVNDGVQDIDIQISQINNNINRL